MPINGSQAYWKALQSQDPWRLDPTRERALAEEQEAFNRQQVAQLAELGRAQAEGIRSVGDITAKGITSAVDAYQTGKQRAAENELRSNQDARAAAADSRSQQEFDMKMAAAKAEEDYLNAPADGSAPPPYAALDGQGPLMAEDEARPMPETNRQAMQRLKMEKAKAEIDSENRKNRPEVENKKPQLVTYTDENGNQVQEFVVPKPGEKFGPKTPTKGGITPKTLQETKYRYNTLVQNADKLKKQIQKSGTTEVFGPEGGNMDRLIYEMAIDYAKLVDPDSVAREGEVNAAQKYMLPVRESFLGIDGMGVRNKTALASIENYKKSLKDRLKARGIDIPEEEQTEDLPPPPAGQVRVRNPQTGKSGVIPKAGLPQALQNGYVEVQ